MAEVVLVHGAWHDGSCWDGVVAELHRLGVRATAVELPLAGLLGDIAVARAAIEAAGPASVVVAHSYGGAVISSATAGLPGVARLVYLAAFLTTPDEDMSTMLSPSLVQAMVIDERGVGIDPASAARVFYGDADPEVAATFVARLRPLAISAEGSGTDPAWRSVPSTYVVCTNDQALPVDAQRRMAARAQTVLEWPTDHCPFLTRPRSIAELIAGYVA